jgi:hypothetical protein
MTSRIILGADGLEFMQLGREQLQTVLDRYMSTRLNSTQLNWTVELSLLDM